MFEGLAEQLADLRTVWRWDQRGCGRSRGDGPHTVDRYVADLDEIVTAAGAPVDLLGHSWGAQLALTYALAHPDRVRRLVYVSGVGLSLHSWRPEFAARTARRLDPDRVHTLEAGGRQREAAMLQWAADVPDPARGAELAEAMATPWFPINDTAPAGINADLAAHWDEAAVEAACRSLAVPTLILEGAEDRRPRWAVDPLAAALPDVTRVVLPGVGHLPWLEAPEPALAALRGFLEAGW